MVYAGRWLGRWGFGWQTWFHYMVTYLCDAQTLVVYAALWLAWALMLVVPTRYLVLLAGLYEFTFRLLPEQVRGLGGWGGRGGGSVCVVGWLFG